MHNKIIPMLALAVTMTAAAVQAGPISGARVEKREGSYYGHLYLKVNGTERRVASMVSRAWLIEGGDAAIYAEDGGSKMDFHTDSLQRYNADGSTKLLLGHFTGIDSLRVEHGRSGKTALVVSGTSDGTGAPTAAVVDPKRGVVWKQYNSRVVAVRNGRAAIAVYNREEGGEPNHRPIRFLYPDLDMLLKRPALRIKE